jgi:hypothetical protein
MFCELFELESGQKSAVTASKFEQVHPDQFCLSPMSLSIRSTPPHDGMRNVCGQDVPREGTGHCAFFCTRRSFYCCLINGRWFLSSHLPCSQGVHQLCYPAGCTCVQKRAVSCPPHTLPMMTTVNKRSQQHLMFGCMMRIRSCTL